MSELDPAILGLPAGDRRRKVKEVLEQRHLALNASPEVAAAVWAQERFVDRARALFYARMMFLTLGLLILAVPTWATYFNLRLPFAFVGYFVMLCYSIANFLVISHRRAGHLVTYITLCADLVITMLLILSPHESGGLMSPLLATQLLFTTLFAILFPKPLAILPPLLALPLTTRVDLLLNRESPAGLLTLLWYFGLNVIIIYVLVYMNEREAAAQRDVAALQEDLKELAVVEERNRLSREIHDGLGATLSSLIIQAEYVLKLAHEERLQSEIREIKTSAEEAIDELRRSLRMMREDFDLTTGVQDYVRSVRDKTQQEIRFERSGVSPKLSPGTQLALFRVLQEGLSNATKHAQAKQIWVRLWTDSGKVHLSIRDDGVGFDPRSVSAGHYGLKNMHERAMSLHGEVLLDAIPGKGTQVVFSLPEES